MNVPPLDPVHVVVQLALVFAGAFLFICGLIIYVRRHPQANPGVARLDDQLRHLVAGGNPFTVILIAPPTAEDDTAALEKSVSAAVRGSDYLSPLDEHRLAFTAAVDRAETNRLVARLAALAQSGTGPAFSIGVASSPADGQEPAVLTAAASDRLLAALHAGRPVAAPPPQTQRAPAELTVPSVDAAAAAREVERFMRTARRGGPVSLLYVEVDQVGRYNEQYGAAFVQQLVGETGVQARALVRRSDLIAHIDNVRLLIALHAPCADSQNVAQRLVSGLRRTAVAPKGTTLKITVSIGLASTPQHAGNAVELLDMAYAAMNVAKGSGGNTVSVYEPGTPVAGRTQVPRDVF